MTTTTLSSPITAASPSVGGAFRELTLAGRHVITALWSTFHRSAAASSVELSPMEEAARVRTLALKYVKTDPGFAADLFAAADRHELQAET
jgi:hypothetical protein